MDDRQTAAIGSKRRALKRAVNALAMALASPCALACWIEQRAGGSSQAVFVFCTHVFAMLPGTPGLFLRRAFYRWTLERCAEEVTVEFGALFSRRTAILETGAYVGAYALLGSAWIQENCLIGSRASVLSGGLHHELLPSGRWSATDHAKLRRVIIGANTWIGEGAIVMADTGEGAMVAAGAVVSNAVPAGVMVAGNPARFVKRLTQDSVPVSVDANSISAVR